MSLKSTDLFFFRDLFQSVGSWNPACLKELSSLNPEDSLQMLYQYNMNNKCFVLLPQTKNNQLHLYIYIYFTHAEIQPHISSKALGYYCVYLYEDRG